MKIRTLTIEEALAEFADDKLPILYCDVCGCSSKEKKINVHSTINMPISLSYCEDCDNKGYITEDELIRYLAVQSHKEYIIKNIDFIIENANILAKTMLKRRMNEFNE